MHKSVMVLTIPQPLATETLSWLAKSVGRIEAVLRMTCRVLSLGLTREMYLQPEQSHSQSQRYSIEHTMQGCCL